MPFHSRPKPQLLIAKLCWAADSYNVVILFMSVPIVTTCIFLWWKKGEFNSARQEDAFNTRRIVLALQIEGLCNEDRVQYYNKAYNMMQEVSIDYVVCSQRKREDNFMMIFMDRTGQEDKEGIFAVMMDDIRRTGI